MSLEETELRWVGQEDEMGCGVATLAMITGKTYEQVKSDLHFIDLTKEGIDDFTFIKYLAEHGLIPVKVESEISQHHHLASIYLCVVTVEKDISGEHFVLMLKNGQVFDPLTPDIRNLSDYPKINVIYAIMQIRQDWVKATP